jgi:uncharacterized protein (DUF2141 family)
MKHIFFILTILILCSSKPVEEKGELKVLIKGLDVFHGKVALELLNAHEEQVAEYWLFVESESLELIVPNLVQGDYALRFFHDENNNGVMDKNWLGIPTEAFGFSNDARVFLGPPAIKDMIFGVKKHTDITVNARRL